MCPLEVLATKCSSQTTLIEALVRTEGGYSPAWPTVNWLYFTVNVRTRSEAAWHL